MKRVHVICAVLISAVALISRASPIEAETSRPADAAGARGEQTYRQICQGCHMSAGQGAEGAGSYPALARNPRLVAWQYIALIVLNGRNGMPSFGLPAGRASGGSANAARLSDAEIADVVNYVRSHFGNRYRDSAREAELAALPHPREGAAP